MNYYNKDILTVTEGLILHGVNCQKVMGSGIAGQIRKKYPEVYHKFLLMPHGETSLGKLQIVNVKDDLYIGNGFTQLYYGKDGKQYASVKAIEQVVDNALFWCHIHNLPLISPKIGCGLGGLDWDMDVEPIFKEYENRYAREYGEVSISIYEYDK